MRLWTNDGVKDKFHKLKDEAENSTETAKNYFNDLKGKATEMFKEHFPEAEQHFEEFFNGPKNDKASSAWADKWIISSVPIFG